ncbi:MAG: hypothetical protein CK425_03150 [Parachlamydia sp.]|nr:MAG: hypothetical protein CK425_03150 [Parachlamydia sp.]
MEQTSVEEKKQYLRELKKSYVNALIKALRPSGNVLEVGFGLGDGASFIQQSKPKSHTIIESDPHLAKEAEKWASKFSNVKVIADSWQNALPKLGVFDTIFYNDYPIDNEIDLIQSLSTEDANEIAKRSKELLEMLETELAQVEAAYTDHEIDEFYQQLGYQNPTELFNFFEKLKEHGHITPKQYNHVIKKYQIEEPKVKSPAYDFSGQADVLLLFLQECLKKHMHKGSRFTAYLNDRTSKFEDSRFFEAIITNPHIEYQEKQEPLQVANCKGEVLVMTVEKLSDDK